MQLDYIYIYKTFKGNIVYFENLFSRFVIFPLFALSFAETITFVAISIRIEETVNKRRIIFDKNYQNVHF